jgi:hypothetical protein
MYAYEASMKELVLSHLVNTMEKNKKIHDTVQHEQALSQHPSTIS